MIGEAREAREDTLHGWVADGLVEHRYLPTHGCNYNGDHFTEYRVRGGINWYSDLKGQFPTERLIARLALDIQALQPQVNPITPQWQHAWMLPVRKKDSIVVYDGAMAS